MKCIICGKEIEKSLFNGAVLCSCECFEENFWNEIIAEKEDHIIIDGVCYRDAGNKPDFYRGFLGHSGRRFYIEKFDGARIATNDLWCQGTIPDKYRNELKDNASFCRQIKLVEGGANY